MGKWRLSYLHCDHFFISSLLRSFGASKLSYGSLLLGCFENQTANFIMKLMLFRVNY